MTTISLLFFSIVLTGSCAVALVCWSADQKTRNVFKSDDEDRCFTYLCSCGKRHLVGDTCNRPFKQTPTDHDKARNLASATLKRIHP